MAYYLKLTLKNVSVHATLFLRVAECSNFITGLLLEFSRDFIGIILYRVTYSLPKRPLKSHSRKLAYIVSLCVFLLHKNTKHVSLLQFENTIQIFTVTITVTTATSKGFCSHHMKRFALLILLCFLWKKGTSNNMGQIRAQMINASSQTSQYQSKCVFNITLLWGFFFLDFVCIFRIGFSAGVPSAPGKVIASRNTKTAAFVQWEPSKQGRNLMGYYVDCCVVGSKVWVPCNHRPYKHTK